VTTNAWTPKDTTRRAGLVLDEIERAVVGKRAAIELVLIGIMAAGHVLIEDLPGLGKTLVARSFADVLGLSFVRVQFTPDLLPSDLTGATFYDQRIGDFVFRPGPIFTNVLLADEINRTPPKTQAALLEAMAESQVSIDGRTHPLPSPFVVIATDNPIEYEGTYPLPEAQLDRFVLRVRLGYLAHHDETALLSRRLERGSTAPKLREIATAAELLAMRESLEVVAVHPDVVAYIVRLLEATRSHQSVSVGASPRGGLALMQLARGRAIIAGRDFVLPDDVKAVATPALAHRLSLKPETWVRKVTTEDVVGEILAQVETPSTRSTSASRSAPAAR
jgi:MoxR-like ATPase